MNYIKVLILSLLVLSLKCYSSQQLPVVNIFNILTTTAVVTADLNAVTLTAQQAHVPESTTITSVLESNGDYFTVLVEKVSRDFLGFGLGKYYLANNSYQETQLFKEEGLSFFAFFDPAQYYDPVANLISMCGVTDTITITTYDIETSGLTIYNTTILANEPIGTVGPQPSQVSVFYFDVNTTDATLLVFETDSADDGTIYTIENYNQTIVNSSYTYPLTTKGELYLVAIEGDTLIKTITLLQVEFSTSNEPTATVKPLYSIDEVYAGGIPCLVTEDQQNIIIISSPNINTTSINFSVYNIQSTQSQTVNIENTLDISMDEYCVYFAQ